MFSLLNLVHLHLNRYDDIFQLLAIHNKLLILYFPKVNLIGTRYVFITIVQNIINGAIMFTISNSINHVALQRNHDNNKSFSDGGQLI